MQIDPTGPGLPNIEVDLMPSNSNGQPVAVTNTKPGGSFSFKGVGPGVYELEVQTPTGLFPVGGTEVSLAPDLNTNQSAGNTGGTIKEIGSTGNAATPSLGLNYVVVSPTGHESYSGIVFSFVPAGSVEGTVYNDEYASENLVSVSSATGTADPLLPGVTVKLTGTDQNGQPVSLSTTTDGNGFYNFEVGPSNSAGYTVSVVTPRGFLAEDTPQQFGNPAGSSGGVAVESGLAIRSIPVFSNQEETGYNFGFVSPDSISGYALNDTLSLAPSPPPPRRVRSPGFRGSLSS